MTAIAVIGAMAFSGWLAVSATPGDQDRDGIADNVEQALLLRFAPTFMISATDCDEAPAEFRPGSMAPRAIAKNGTIYGQVFPLGESRIEIHYYHLWQRDCGRRGHALDVEHVSAWIENDKAQYWYASSHQDTICDASHAVKASTLSAEVHGPLVWVSDGKHASFLIRDRCGQGCGGDRCAQMHQLTIHQIINIGELDHPANGAVWIASHRWPLASKMGSDFNARVFAQLQAANADVSSPVHPSPPGVQPAVRAGGATMDAIDMSDRKTSDALDTASGKVDRSLRRAHRSVREWFRRRQQ